MRPRSPASLVLGVFPGRGAFHLLPALGVFLKPCMEDEMHEQTGAEPLSQWKNGLGQIQRETVDEMPPQAREANIAMGGHGRRRQKVGTELSVCHPGAFRDPFPDGKDIDEL